MIQKTGPKSPKSVCLVRMVVGVSGRLFASRHHFAVFFFLVVMLEDCGIQYLGERKVEETDVYRKIVALVSVIMPGMGWRQDNVTGTECYGFALDTREILFAGQTDAGGIDGMPVRRHDFTRVVETIGSIEC